MKNDNEIGTGTAILMTIGILLLIGWIGMGLEPKCIKSGCDNSQTDGSSFCYTHMYLLVKRASLCHIVTESLAKDFYIKAGQCGWKKNEPVWSEMEEPFLFEMLVFRAVCEGDISVQKGAELLQQSYSFVEEHCFAAEG